MSNQTARRPNQIISQPTNEAVQAAARLLRIIRFRRQYILGTLAIAALLGMLYYLTAPRIYQGTASVLVTQTGGNVWNASTTPDGGHEAFIPTYVQLFDKAVVVDIALRQIAKLPPDLRIDFRSHPPDKWPTVLREHLTARSARRTNLIDVTYESQSPQAAKAIVRAVVEAFMAFVEKHHQNVSVEIATLLDEERGKIERQLVEKQKELLELKHHVRDLGLRDKSNVTHPTVQRVVRINESLVKVQEVRVQLKGVLAAVRSAVARGEDLRPHLAAVEPSVGRELMLGSLGLNPQLFEAIGQTERRLLEDRATLQAWLDELGPQHPEVVRLTRTIENAERFLATYQQSVKQNLGNTQDADLGPMLLSLMERKLAETQSEEKELLREYAAAEGEAVSQNDRMAELQVSEAEVGRLRTLHETLLNRISNVDINQNRADVRVAVVSEASASNRPVAPRLKLVVVLCMFGGVGGGVTLIYILNLLDDRFRSPEELREELGFPVLALVRELGVLDGEGAAGLQIHVDPSAVESEAFRTLRTALACVGQETERLAVTSSQPGDGKTTVLANLAAACAQAGRKTLVIDGDLRRPGLTRLFGMRGCGGLSEVLRTDEDIATACTQRIRNTGVANLDILPCGPRPSDPAELLSRRRLAELIAWAETAYDQVLVDCPPIQAASDAALIGREMDGVLLVVQPSENPRRAVVRSVESLRSMKINLIGIVANRLAAQKGGYYEEGYEYGIGYGTHYGGVAEDEKGDGEGRDETAAPLPQKKTKAPVRRRAA